VSESDRTGRLRRQDQGRSWARATPMGTCYPRSTDELDCRRVKNRARACEKLCNREMELGPGVANSLRSAGSRWRRLFNESVPQRSQAARPLSRPTRQCRCSREPASAPVGFARRDGIGERCACVHEYLRAAGFGPRTDDGLARFVGGSLRPRARSRASDPAREKCSSEAPPDLQPSAEGSACRPLGRGAHIKS
jgi:hypothetical protein